MIDQGYINHIVLVLDESSSMRRLRHEVVKVADSQIAYLAARSQELDQETRVSVYTFADTVRCIIYDKDVLRLPSLAGHYNPEGMTALIDATLKSQDDLAQTAQLYGDHAFLTYVLTDGLENRSRNNSVTLLNRLNNLPDNWTVAVLVPDQRGIFEAKKFGFPKDNIAKWDTSVEGIREVGGKIKAATDNFMTARSTGVRSSKSIFDMSAANLNRKVVQTVLSELPPNKYQVLDVYNGAPDQIRDFVQRHGLHYRMGMGYYQLTKRESIQTNKQICVYEKATGRVYSGQQARNILGLPDQEVRVSPQDNPEYDVFVQSTSVNRKLVPGTKLLVMT